MYLGPDINPIKFYVEIAVDISTHTKGGVTYDHMMYHADMSTLYFLYKKVSDDVSKINYEYEKLKRGN